jgi:hypothetical protein
MNKETVDLNHQTIRNGMTPWPLTVINKLNHRPPLNPERPIHTCLNENRTDYSEEEMRGRYRD